MRSATPRVSCGCPASLLVITASANGSTWPFQGYFALLAPLQANPQVSYMMYALISRVPFLIGSAVVMAVATMQWHRCKVASQGHATDTSV